MGERRGKNWVERVVAKNPGPLTLEGTCTYLLGGEPCLVVDPGPGLGSHLARIEFALGSAEVMAICLTHYHADHAGGAAELGLRLGVPLAATPETAERAGLKPPELPLAEGTVVGFGGGRLEVVSAPGHCPDHVCFYWPDRRALFTGDVILGEGTSMVAPPEGDMSAYLATLRRLAQLDPAVIYPGHGEPISDPEAKLAEYIRHRFEREGQVLAALAAGAATPEEIRVRVYADLDPRLHRAAEGSVRAHLAKLVSDGRVSVEGEHFAIHG